jgi:hypothetical protein
MSTSNGPFTPSALLASSDSTPKNDSTEYQDDTVMTSSSMRPSSSSYGLGMDSQMSSAAMPTSLPLSQTQITQQAPTSAQPEATLTFEEYMARNPIPAAVLQQSQAQQDFTKSLFNANESNFLTNFLQGFEGWDFNPNLPIDLPSFADAERDAFAYGPPPSLPSAQDYRRTSRKSTASSKGKASPGTVRRESSSTFARPRGEWNDDIDDDRGRRKGDSMMMDDNAAMGKKIKMEHGAQSQSSHQAFLEAQAAAAAASKRDQLSDQEKRQNHILSEQRRRNHIREAFKELVDLLESGREFGARGLGLSSGAGTGIEDEGLDDRSDYESTLEDEEAAAAAKRRKAKAKRKAAMEAVMNSGGRLSNGAAATRGRGKGRGRGGSAGGGAGSKSAVLFQAVDLLQWLEGRNQVIANQVQELDEVAPPPAVKVAS